jgi:serine protease
MGMDYDHPDLYRNVWINQPEIPISRMKNLVDVYHDGYISWRDLNNPINIGPGKITDVDSDGVIDAGDILSPMILNPDGTDSGLGGWANPKNVQDGDTAHADDLIGWNFVNNTNDPLDDNDHGTHTAGIIAAMGNKGVVVVGVNWTAQVMPLKIFDASGNDTDAAAAEPIEYAADYGAKVSNNSWGGSGDDPRLGDAIQYASDRNEIFVAAAGNSANNNDITPFYPAFFNLPNVIAVAETDINGNLAGFSNYGAHTESP